MYEGSFEETEYVWKVIYQYTKPIFKHIQLINFFILYIEIAEDHKKANKNYKILPDVIKITL
jgi:hypothetical protein